MYPFLQLFIKINIKLRHFYKNNTYHPTRAKIVVLVTLHVSDLEF